MKTPEHHALEALQEGQEARLAFAVDAAELERFAELSGDHNPLHCDAEYARARGFEGQVVHGALLVSKLSALIGMQLPGLESIWNQVKVDFRAPLYLGEAAEWVARVRHVSEAARVVTLEIELRAGERRLASGKAGVSLRPAGDG